MSSDETAILNGIVFSKLRGGKAAWSSSDSWDSGGPVPPGWWFSAVPYSLIASRLGWAILGKSHDKIGVYGTATLGRAAMMASRSRPGFSRSEPFSRRASAPSCTSFWAVVLGQAGKNDHRDVCCYLGLFQRAKHLYYFRLGGQIPENHLLRLIDKHIDLVFVREKLKESYSETGRPSIES